MLTPKTEPFLGNMIVEAIEDKASDYVAEKSGVPKEERRIVFTEDFDKKYSPPVRWGIIRKVSPDTYGEWFQDKYKSKGYTPTIGDKILFVTVLATPIDIDRKWLVVPEEAVQAYERGESNE